VPCRAAARRPAQVWLLKARKGGELRILVINKADGRECAADVQLDAAQAAKYSPRGARLGTRRARAAPAPRAGALRRHAPSGLAVGTGSRAPPKARPTVNPQPPPPKAWHTICMRATA
jgi:hypothetical protein